MAYVEKQENFKKTLYWGVGELSLVAINPTKAQLNKLRGVEDKDDDKEIEYLNDNFEIKTKDENGEEVSETVKKLNITFWMKENKTKELFPVFFSLIDKDSVSKTGKLQFVNQFGMSSFVDSEENLEDWFSTCKFSEKKGAEKQVVSIDYRMAKMGEAELLNFIAKLTNINRFKPNNNLFLEDYKKFWKGDVKELRAFLEVAAENKTICCLFGVKHKDGVDDDGNDVSKTYQVVSNKFIFPGFLMKYFKNYSKKNFEGIPAKMGYDSLYDLNKFLEAVKDGEYGFKDSYKLVEIEQYNEEEDVVASNNVEISEDDANY